MFNIILKVMILFSLFHILFINAYNYIEIIVYVGNSFTNYHSIPNKTITCLLFKEKYKCTFTELKGKRYDASIYNGNRKFPKRPNSSYNIMMTIEKLSQVIFMKNISEGRNKNYQLAIDYRLFENKFHIAHPYLADISNLIYLANRNYNNSQNFIKRNNNIVYIQKKHYKNRQNIVKDIMNYYDIDSYGKDLNNKEWPLNISRQNKIDLMKNYKFCLAIENSVQTWKYGDIYEADAINNDYVTEKLFDCFQAGSIPIYFGPKNIHLFLPHNNSIINLNRFRNTKELANYLNIIKNNNSLLYTHLKWHYKYSHNWYNRFAKLFKFNYCKICNYVKQYS